MGTLRKNVAGQYFFVQMRKQSDGSPFTDPVTGTIAKDAAADAAMTGTVTHLANGKYRVAPSQADTNGNALGFGFTGTGALAVTANFITTAIDPQAAAVPANLTYAIGVPLSAPPVGGRLDVHIGTIDSAVEDGFIKKVWDYLESAITLAGSIGLKIKSNLDAAVGTRSSHSAADVWTAGGRTITGGTVDTCTTNTDMRGTDGALLASAAPANFSALFIQPVTGRVDLGLWRGNAPDDLTTGLVKASAENAVSVDSTSTTAIASASASAVAALEGDAGITWSQSMQILNASQGAKTSGGGTTNFNIRNPADTKNRIAAVVDSNGNRSMVTLNLD